jgi:hypothetical protein
MAKKEAVLEYRLSIPNSFHCSLCGHGIDEGAFVTRGTIGDLIAGFKRHVGRYHTKDDAGQAVARILREATKD